MNVASDPILLGLLLLVVGLVLGLVLGGWLQRLRLANDFMHRDVVQRDFVPQAVFASLREQSDVLEANLQEKQVLEKELTAQLASERTRLEQMQQRVGEQHLQLADMQKQNREAFENMANRLLEEKSQKFTHQNQTQLDELLKPLKEKIQLFESNIERRHLEETRDRVSLKKEIEQLRELNQQLSQDAGNLTAALKGDSKTQGDWGEVQLELLLEKAGLQRDVHFRTQSSFRDEEGKLKRPDFIINLPGDKHLIIDCKVSLTAYERYCSSQDEQQRAKHLKAHLSSMRKHIKDLRSKKYQRLYQINTPDYLLLFVPIEPAFALAVQEDQRLFLDALDCNIVLVTNSTLLATMRTVAFIWKQEKQQRSVREIAMQSGQLYDKFVNFVEDLQQVGQRLDGARNAFDAAMYKLSEGKRYSQTLVGRAEKLRRMGARNTKLLPPNLREEE